MELGFRLAGASAALAVTFGAVAIAAPNPTAHLPGATAGEAAPAAVEQPAASTLAVVPGTGAPLGLGAPTTPSNMLPMYDLNYRPDAGVLWRRHLAADPAQAVMPVRNWCPTASTLQALPFSQRYEIALRRLHDFTPTTERYNLARNGIVDIRAQVAKAFPRNFAYDRTDDTNPKVVDIGTQVKRFVLHYTESQRKDWGGYAFAKLIANMGTGVGYNYFVNETETNSDIFYTAGEFVHHTKGHNPGAFGVEVAACSQAGISPRQWESLLYLAAHFLESNNMIAKDRPVAAIVNSTIVGHREIGGALGHPDFPAVVAEPFRWRLIAFLVQELGYTP
ncbi:MAG: peptidoglycan recognition protein family protein [Sporichthyaceae bacterium]